MKKTSKSSSRKNVPLAIAAATAGLSAEGFTSIRTWLVEQLVAQEYAKLGQGGHVQNDVPLRSVFVDLPVAGSPNVEYFQTDRVLFLEKLLTSQPISLRHSGGLENSISLLFNESVEVESLEENQDVDSYSDCSFSLTLLIGGPGQGKSTVSQLACQLHRAALLIPFEEDLTSSQRNLIHTFKTVTGKQSRRTPLGLPKIPLLPLQIVLPEFAAWMAKENSPVRDTSIPLVLSFLTELPSAKKCGLTAEILRDLVSALPSLIVLDGFDEVGSKRDRMRLVSAARELINYLAGIDGYAQVIATTRPQGYAGELEQIGVKLQEQYLAPLTKQEAINYAQKLIEVKIPNVDQQSEMLGRLREAANEPATERLLTTPLQVTILTALVQQLGRAPRERWNLFYRYFKYTYDREIERNTYASRLLSDYRSQIEQIHARAALLLQVEAERAGGASARMSKAQLESIVDAVLLEEEFSEDLRQTLVRDITIAAEQRLVFLVEPEPGSFGFEIRSLQEFMAAWAITSGRDSDIEARMMQIAKAPMFRNVMLFVISKLFSEGSPLRDVLAVKICNAIDNDLNDDPSRVTFAGSLLALEALEEGAALSQPKRARALMQRATNLLNLPPSTDHVRLARVANNDSALVLRDSIEQVLKNSKGSTTNCQAAWVCLIEACNIGEQWAIELGDIYWQELNEPTRIVRSCRDVGIRLGKWFSYRIQEAAEKISPHEFINLKERNIEKRSPLNWTVYLVYILGHHSRWERRSRPLSALTLIETNIDVVIDPEKMGPPPPAWRAWIDAAHFEVEPNSRNLATALNSITTSIPFGEWKFLGWRVSWPLQACITKARNDIELRQFANRIVTGQLGDTDDWFNAQKNWVRKVNFSDSIAQVNQDSPWALLLKDSAPPLLVVPLWNLFARESTKVRAGYLSKANHEFLNAQNGRVKAFLAELCFLLERGLSKKSNKESFDRKKWLSFVQIEGIATLIPRPSWLDHESWIGIFEKVEERDLDRIETFCSASDGIKAIVESQGHPHIVRLILSCFEMHLRLADIVALDDTDLKLKFRELASAYGSTRLDLLIVWLYLGAIDDLHESQLVNDILNSSNSEPIYWKHLISALAVGRLSGDATEQLLRAIYPRLLDANLFSNEAVQQYRKQLQFRLSGLENPVTWNKLGLPLPAPIGQSESFSNGRFPKKPTAIESIELRNICGFQNLRLPLNCPEENAGQWTVILGPNGAGKTTILRSIALALRDATDVSGWPRNVFGSGWQRVPNDNELAVTESEIKLKIKNGLELHTNIRSVPTFVVKQSPETDSLRQLPLFAYGCRRGSALGGVSREVDLGTAGGPEIATLFDDQSDLIHAETWLLQLEADALKNSLSLEIFNVVIGALKILLSVDNIEVIDRKIWISQTGQPKLQFSSLSDGYLTSAGWFLDLLARWLELSRRYNQEITPRFMGSMSGLVLIDEIDLHLHPQWQIEIIARTKKLLPQMSFVVTTHNPLTLVGAKAEEIWILSRDEKNNVVARNGTDTPMLLTSGQIYRRYFGIEDIYPSELGKQLQRYSFLCGYSLRDESEEAEMFRLKDILDEAGVSPGWDIVPSQHNA